MYDVLYLMSVIFRLHGTFQFNATLEMRIEKMFRGIHKKHIIGLQIDIAPVRVLVDHVMLKVSDRCLAETMNVDEGAAVVSRWEVTKSLGKDVASFRDNTAGKVRCVQHGINQ